MLLCELPLLIPAACRHLEATHVELSLIHGCQDYGNSEREMSPQGPGAMESINFGSMYWDGHGGKGAGDGPWVMADLEHGTWAGNRSGVNPANTPEPQLCVRNAEGTAWAVCTQRR